MGKKGSRERKTAAEQEKRTWLVLSSMVMALCIASLRGHTCRRGGKITWDLGSGQESGLYHLGIILGEISFKECAFVLSLLALKRLGEN